MCKCKWWGILLALVVIVFTLWTPAVWTKWLVVLVGVVILFHAFGCCRCTCETEHPETKKKKK